MNPEDKLPAQAPTVCLRCGAPMPDGHVLGCPACLAEDPRATSAEFFTPLGESARELPGSGFTLLEEIGRGGMGVVYRALQREPRREVAVKVLLPHLASAPDIARRLLAEAAALAEMDHPGILPLFASGEHNGQPWLAMKLATGGTLSSRRAEWTGNWKNTATLLAGLADAVQHAHERGLIHRDIKPGNVLFDENGRACLVDFGLVKWQDAADSGTLTLVVMGTLSYMAPEVATAGGRAATTASDVYGLGATLYELLTGEPPFTGGSTAEMLGRITNGHLEAPRRKCRAIPADLEIICLKAMSREPEGRYARATDFAADLRRWLSGHVILARPSTALEKLRRWSSRNPLPSALTLLLALALSGGGLTVALQNRSLRTTNAALEESVAEARRARAAAEDRVNFSVRELPPLLGPIGRLNLLDGVYQNVAAYYAGMGAVSDAAGLAREAEFRTRWSAVLRQQGRHPEALTQLTEAMALGARAISQDHAGPEAWQAHISALRSRGEYAVTMDQHDEARHFSAVAIRAAEEGLRQHPGSMLLAEMAETLSDQGYAAMELGEGATALPLLGRSLDLWKQLEKTPDFPDKERVARQQATCHHELGRASRAMGDPASALQHFRSAHTIQQEAAHRNPGPNERARDLAVAANRLADQLLQPNGDPPTPAAIAEAGTLLLEAEDFLHTLVKHDAANLQWKYVWGMSALALAHLDYCRQDAPASRRWLVETLRRLEDLPLSAQESVHSSTAWALHYLAQNFSATGDENAEATKHWDQALEVGFNRLVSDPQRWENFAAWEIILRDAFSFRNETTAAAESEQALENWLRRIRAEAARPEAVPWWQRTAATVHRRLADLSPADSPRAVTENWNAFTLRAGLLKDEPRTGQDLINEVSSAAGKLLGNISVSAEVRLAVPAILTACAPRAAMLSPKGSWRTYWAGLVCRAASGFPRGQRGALLHAAIAAFYPPPPSRPWTEEEQKGLTQLQTFAAAEGTPP